MSGRSTTGSRPDRQGSKNTIVSSPLPVRRRISPDEFDRLAKTIVFTPPLFLGEIPCLVLHSSPNLFPIFY